MKRIVVCALTVAFAAGLSLARAADDNRRDEGKGDVDQHFVRMAGAAGLAEVNVGNLAMRMASGQDARRFAQKLVADHSKANEELIRIANRKNLRLPERMDQKHQDAAKKLTSLQGEKFDTEFARGQVKDHEEAIKLFEREAKDGKDEDLKAFADKHLPHLKEHLKMAKQLAGEGNREGASGGTRERSRDRDQDRERR